MKINKIQIPVTGEAGDNVLRCYALYFAKKLEASLWSVDVAARRSLNKPGTRAEILDHAPFSDFIKACREHGIAFETTVCNRSWESTLNDADPDKLVMLPSGKYHPLGAGKLESALIAPSQTILCCPDHYIDIESIALAYDGSNYARRTLDVAVWLSEKAVWPLSVLMVVENQEQGVHWMDEVETFLDTLTINSTTIILSGPVEAALHRFMQEGSVELLIMGTCGHRPHQAGSIGGTATAMLKTANYPLLLVS